MWVDPVSLLLNTTVIISIAAFLIWSIADFPYASPSRWNFLRQTTDWSCLHLPLLAVFLVFWSSSLSPCGCCFSKQRSILLGLLESNLQNVEWLDEKWLLCQEVLSPPKTLQLKKERVVCRGAQSWLCFLLFNRSVMSDSLWLYGLQHSRLPYP